jgi:HSP20 family molecular chaperone IbpA
LQRTAASPGAATGDVSQSGFRIAVDIGAEFEPSDLTVKTVDRKLIVHARHEEKAPGRTSCREFNREFDLPEGIDPQAVTASLGEDGRLVIEAPTQAGGSRP